MEFIYNSERYWAFLRMNLPGLKKVWISTYGLKGPEYKTWSEHPVNQIFWHPDFKPRDFRIAIGIPFVGECYINCPHCKEMKDNIIDTIEHNAEYLRQTHLASVKVYTEFHMKLVVTEKFVIAGGRNLTGSKWTDLTVVSRSKKDIKHAMNIFEQMWSEL